MPKPDFSYHTRPFCRKYRHKLILLYNNSIALSRLFRTIEFSLQFIAIGITIAAEVSFPTSAECMARYYFVKQAECRLVHRSDGRPPRGSAVPREKRTLLHHHAVLHWHPLFAAEISEYRHDGSPSRHKGLRVRRRGQAPALNLIITFHISERWPFCPCQ